MTPPPRDNREAIRAAEECPEWMKSWSDETFIAEAEGRILRTIGTHNPMPYEWAKVFALARSALLSGDRVVVPREPTPQMIKAAWECIRREQKHGKILGPGPGFVEAFAAMIAAAPLASAPDEGMVERVARALWEAETNCAVEYRDRMWNKTDERWPLFIPDDDVEVTDEHFQNPTGRSSYMRSAKVAITAIGGK